MFKRILPVIISAVILLGGCAVKTSSEPLSPEELVKAYYTCLINENYDTAYEKYYSNISKSMISQEDFVSRTSEDMFTSGRTITDILVQSSEQITPPESEITVYKVSGLIKFISNGAEDTDDFFEYVTVQKETNFYRILYKGYLSYKVYTMPTTTERKFHGVQGIVYTTAEGRTLEFTVKNDTAGTVSIGKGDKGPLLELTSGGIVYPYRFEKPVVLKSGEEATIVGQFDGLDGQIEKITLSSIYSVGQDGKVIEGDNGKMYSVSVA